MSGKSSKKNSNIVLSLKLIRRKIKKYIEVYQSAEINEDEKWGVNHVASSLVVAGIFFALLERLISFKYKGNDIADTLLYGSSAWETSTLAWALFGSYLLVGLDLCFHFFFSYGKPKRKDKSSKDESKFVCDSLIKLLFFICILLCIIFASEKYFKYARSFFYVGCLFLIAIILLSKKLKIEAKVLFLSFTLAILFWAYSFPWFMEEKEKEGTVYITTEESKIKDINLACIRAVEGQFFSVPVENRIIKFPLSKIQYITIKDITKNQKDKCEENLQHPLPCEISKNGTSITPIHFNKRSSLLECIANYVHKSSKKKVANVIFTALKITLDRGKRSMIVSLFWIFI